MTLRGRLTSAFLVVVLGPVLLGSIFVALTVGAVSRERAAERLDHAATTARTGIGATCRQLQTVADAVAVVSSSDRQAVADQLIARGLASDIRIATSGAGGRSGWSDCGAPTAAPNSTPTAALSGAPAAAPTSAPAAASNSAPTTAPTGAPSGGVTSSISATATSAAGDLRVTAARAVDAAFLERLTASTGAGVTLGDAAPGGRTLRVEPGQPLQLTLSVRQSNPSFLYAVLAALVLVATVAAVLVARWLAHSTTRPLGDLAWAADRVADGELDTRVPIQRADELGRVAATFNRMTRELQAYVQALTASRDQLRGHLAILGETLSSTHDLQRILQVILRTALAATGARAGLVLLTDASGNQLAAQCAIGLTGDWDVPEAELAERRLPVGEGALGAVAASGEARRGTGRPGSDEPACLTYVAVPIRAPALTDEMVPLPGDPPPGPATLGVLALYDRVGGGAFDDADLQTLRTFAGQAGVAVQNVRVHEEAQRLSLTDPLTGLWNYRYLRESLRREVGRASRFGRMLTVLVLDLDHFKDVNDTYGHAAGDAVLGEFARRVRLGLREVDFAFRQGGEEFVVLLPETDAYGGAIVAERLGAAVRDRPVPIEKLRPGLGDQIPITVSIGIAVYPEHGASAQRVLDAADEALYAAKRAGRDTYRLAEGDVIKSGVSPGEREGNFDRTAAGLIGPRPPRHRRGR